MASRWVITVPYGISLNKTAIFHVTIGDSDLYSPNPGPDPGFLGIRIQNKGFSNEIVKM